ncbi:titin-like isoform X3 [Neocloeon triangulifer]|uniref:titin-like isoform X3 n=1 Tax=Neocloeon triangulifer TaxID=2078957 RepID=UPI00286F6077|nr:titin-like isoform X3 [Neocloeon triangulifer]
MMPTEAMRLDAEEEAARGAVEHLLKTLEKEPAAPEKQLEIKQEPDKMEGEMKNGTEKDDGAQTASDGNETDEELRFISMYIKQEEEMEPIEEMQTEVVSSVVINLLDHMENNVNNTETVDLESEAVNGHYSLPSELPIKEEIVTQSEEETNEKDQQLDIVSHIVLNRDSENEDEAAEEVVQKEPQVETKCLEEVSEKSPETPKVRVDENVESEVSTCVSSLCDVLDSVDEVVSKVEKSPKSKSKPAEKETETAKPPENNEKEKVDEVKEDGKELPKIDPVDTEKVEDIPKTPSVKEPKVVAPSEPAKKKEAVKLPQIVPCVPPVVEKAKRKPRKKKQEPIVAPVLPFPTSFFPPPPLLAPPPALAFNFPAQIPVDLSVAKKKVQKVAPISSVMPQLPQLPSSSAADQVLDLSVRRIPRSEKKVKPIKRLSKKALQSVFHPYVNPADLLQVGVPPMLLPPMPMPHLEARKSKKAAQSAPPPQRITPFVFHIEDRHLGIAPNGTKLYNCDICSGSYQRQFSLKRHYLRSHINTRLLSDRDAANCGIIIGPDTPPNVTDLYRCHFCPALFFRHREELMNHLTLHPDDSIASSGSPVLPLGPPSQVFSCEHCSTTFTNRINLLKHQALHQAQDFPCFYCYRVFSSPTARERHHVQHTNNDNQHPCMFLCGKTFRTLPELRSHLQVAHNKEYFGCSKCTERFMDTAQLDVHTRMAHPGPVHEPPIISITPIIEEPLPPPLPPKQQTSEESIKYSCSMCNESFPSYVSMCKHRRVAHGTVGKHTKTASPAKTPKEKETPSATKKSPVVLYLESKEEQEVQGEFSLPNLSVGKQTVALTSEVTISALPPEEDQAARVEEQPVLIIEKVNEPPKPVPVELPKPVPAAVAETATAVEKKRPNIKIKVKLNLGKKSQKSKKKSSPKVKPKTVLKLIQKERTKETEKPADEAVEEKEKAPVELQEKKETVKQVPVIKVASPVVPAEPEPIIPEPEEPEETPVRLNHPKKYLSKNRAKSPKQEDLAHLCLSTQFVIQKRLSAKKSKKAIGGKKMSRKSSSRPTRNNPHTSEDLASFLHGLDLGLAKYQMPPERTSRRSKKLLEAEYVVEELIEEGFSGDWIRPKRYICHICRGHFSELWDLDDHVNEVHTNIWCTYMDVDAATTLPDDLFQRSIEPNGLVSEAPVLPLTNPAESNCTKCGKNNSTLPDLHKHMLECGGDTTWMLNSPRKRKQWRPFGTRRRARRGMKRIPSSPMKINRAKKQDGDTIQKMIANLPSKRGSRRVINFNDDEIKTRSQATIHSLRPAAANQNSSKAKLNTKPSLPKGRTQAVAERRSSSDSSKSSEKSSKISDKSSKQTAKPLPEEEQKKAENPTESQTPIIVKLKKKKVFKKVAETAPAEEKPEPAIEPAETPSEEKLVEYGPKHNKYAATACPYCDKGLLNHFSLIRHLKICPKEPNNASQKQTSAEVPKKAATKEVKEENLVNACPLCNEIFSSSKLLERHASNCCESASEISNRKKVFRRRASEMSEASKKSNADSEAQGSDPDIRKSKKVGKLLNPRKDATKKLIQKAKLPVSLQRLGTLKKMDAIRGAESGSDSEKPKKRNRELENLALSMSIFKSTDSKLKKAQPKEKSKPVTKAGKRGKILEDVKVEPETNSSQETNKEAVETVGHLIDMVENQSGESGKRKKFGKKSKKIFKSSALVETDSESSVPVPEKAIEEKVVEDGGKKTKKSTKETEILEVKVERKKSLKKKKSEIEPEAPQSVPKEEELPDKKPGKSKKKKEGKAKKNIAFADTEDDLPLSQIIKLKKTEGAETAQIPSESEKLKKSKKKSESKESPQKKKTKVEEVVEVASSSKRPVEEEEEVPEEPPAKKKRGRKSDENKTGPMITFCAACKTSYSTAFNFHKHLKSMKHLNNVMGEGMEELDVEDPVTKDNEEDGIVPDAELEKEEEEEDLDEIVFPFIKEGTPPFPPPPPPNSPFSPMEEEKIPEIAEEVTKSFEEVKERKEAKVKSKEVVAQEKSDDEEEWFQPTPLQPPPKWDFDAVRDSVPNWTAKPAPLPMAPSTEDPVPPPQEIADEDKNYDDVYGGIVNQLIQHSDYPPPPEVAPLMPVVSVPPNPYLMGNYEGQQSLEQIQQAMGATDEEMAMLENLGGGTSLVAFVYDNSSSYEAAAQQPGCSATLVNLANATGPIEPLENAEIMDLDNQISEQEQSTAEEVAREEVFLPPVVANIKYAAKSSVPLETAAEISEDLGSTSSSSKLLSMYEQKEMVCPMCSKHFLGLQALEAHISWAHKVKDTKMNIQTDVNNAAKSSDQIARERDCLLVGLAAANMLHHAGGMRSGVLRAAAGAVADECAQKKRKIACFVCKELYTDMVALNAHIRKQHVKSKVEINTNATGNGLKAKMTSALGGLLDRALSSMLGKVPLPPVEKSMSDGSSKEDADDRASRTPLINLDTPLTLTAIAKQAIKPVSISEQSMEESGNEESLESVINKRRKSALKELAPKPEEVEKPPLFPEYTFTPSSFDPILPEPQGPDMQCPICLGAVKHFHSLCRHLKTQHTEWAMNTFNTDLFHYLILKRDNPPITINKKYTIYIPGKNIQSPVDPPDSQQWNLVNSKVSPQEPVQEDPQLTQREGSPSKDEDDDIRIKAYAALQQLCNKKSLRGSKRRPLNLNDLAQAEKDSGPS